MTVKIISKPFLIGATAAALACGIAGYAWREGHRKPILEIYVFDLKSGSSVFIRTPDDKRILIDGGADSAVIRELTDILPFYSRRIDMIIATDAYGKDVSGLIDVLERYSVDKVVVPAVSLQSLGLASSTDQIYATFIDTVKRLKVSMVEVSAGDVLDFGQGVVGQGVGGQTVQAKVLFPVVPVSVSPGAASSSKPAFQYSNASAPEIILKISYDQTSVLLLGNATPKVQKFVASSTVPSTTASSVRSGSNPLRADVLVVPHSALPDYFAASAMNEMKPEYLIYSQAVTSATKKVVPPDNATTTSSKNQKVDPLYFVLDDKRFNVKEKGTVKAVLDGQSINIAQ